MTAKVQRMVFVERWWRMDGGCVQEGRRRAQQRTRAGETRDSEASWCWLRWELEPL